ncbi:MAG TPA: zinc ribbon domain-containing protein [Ardenticatenaceae bacterium]
MADLITCPTCGTPDQEIGKYCEHCGSKVERGAATAATADAVQPDAVQPDAVQPDAVQPDAVPADAVPAATGNGSAPDVAVPAPSGNGASASVDAAATTVAPASAPTSGPTTDALRFIRLENGVFIKEQAFDVPVGSRLLVGRADPTSGIFPEVDLTMWSKRVPTPEGSLYTVHRKQCYISRDDAGQVWIVDHTDYVGDTMVSPVGTSQFRPIPSLAGERPTDPEGGVALDVGDRILMGQGEGMLIFQLMRL